MNRAFAALVAVMFLCGGSAFAVIVNPGDSIVYPVEQEGLPHPDGDVIDEDLRNVTFHYVAPEGYGFQQTDQASLDATLRSRVYRDPVTQFLTFEYEWLPDPETSFGREGGSMLVSSFASFTTDVSGELGGGDGTINRSADGSVITAHGASFGLGSVRRLIVETNAVAYDDGGSLTSDIADEFNVVPLDDPEAEERIELAIAEVTLAGTFQPITDTGNPLIPLPAGVWGGLVMLGGAAGVARRLRRR